MRFTAKCRSRGGTKNYKPWLKLNEHRLSVGLVLHEFAHVIQYMTLKGSQPHGIEFVRILDNLVSEYFMHQV